MPQTRGSVVPISLFATAIVGFLTLASLLFLPLTQNSEADMRIEPISRVIKEGEQFTVSIVVESAIPVNVFAGDISFDTSVLHVASIDYNTSIADLWAERPWYSNGDGTLNFAGGTTRRGGFIGTDTLLSITFEAHAKGAGTLKIDNARILQHDGLGTDAEIKVPIDALFTVEEAMPENVLQGETFGSSYDVVEELPSSDLNGDGKVGMADASILLLNLGSTEKRFDLNLDGSVDFRDLNTLFE